MRGARNTRHLVGHIFDEKLLLVVAAGLFGVPAQFALAVDSKPTRPACAREHLGSLFADALRQRRTSNRHPGEPRPTARGSQPRVAVAQEPSLPRSLEFPN